MAIVSLYTVNHHFAKKYKNKIIPRQFIRSTCAAEKSFEKHLIATCQSVFFQPRTELKNLIKKKERNVD